jgi:hypothetical protein
MKAKMGRPKLDVTRAVLIGARFTTEEAELIKAAVSRSKRVKSEWIREALLSAVGASPTETEVPPASSVVFQAASEGFLD